MAVSTIPKATGTITTTAFTGYIVGTTETQASGFISYNSTLKIIELTLSSVSTGAALSVGNTYNIGSLTNYKPKNNIYFDINRRDGGSAVGTVVISSTDGVIKLQPLVSIPSGVTLRAHATYFYQ